MGDKCEMCRQACKGGDKKDCKFYPKECFLGYMAHFKEDPTKYYSKHESTSRICVVCKEYFNYKNIKWWKGRGGMYSFCPVCWKRHLFCLENMKEMAVV